MKFKNLFSLLIVSALIFQGCSSEKPASPESIARFNNIIPLPSQTNLDGKAFTITSETQILFDNGPEVLEIAQLLSNKLNSVTGFQLMPKQLSGEPPANSILLTLSGGDETLGNEGYELNITSNNVKLIASKPAGIYMGVQSLRQLLPESIEKNSITKDVVWEIATGTVRDTPAYSWRGSMLDVARHFLTVDEVKRYIDLISLYKMNMLHLSLTNDQGWRIEIKSWPKLALVGGQTQVGGNGGGFYTQEQYKDIVEYAKARYITIVPEIDMPGHINAALASYGELNGGIIVPKEGRIETAAQGELGIDKPTQLYSGTEVGFSTLSLNKPATFKFVEDVIRELSAITPGPYIHIGGDEAHVTKKPDYIQFINRFQQIVEANGKIMVGWEEIAQGDVNTNSVAQHWHSKEMAALAASKGARILLSPSTNVYLDMKYDTASRIGYHWAAYIEVDSSYKWKPEVKVPGVAPELIVGVEAPLWGETIQNFDDVEYLTFPRIPGAAEIGWTPTNRRQWDEYKIRLGNHAKRFKALDIDYYRSKLVPWID